MEENSDCGGGCLQVMDRKSGEVMLIWRLID